MIKQALKLNKAKFVVLSAVLLTISVCSNAASWMNHSYNVFEFGARGGVYALTTGDAGVSGGMGFSARFDAGYTHYFDRKRWNLPYLGIHTGLSLGYASASINGSVKDTYSTTDASGDKVDYTIVINDVKATVGQLQLQIPVMFAFYYNGLFANAGVRMGFPLYSPYTQTLEDVHISAYYEAYDVTITDALIIGKLTDSTSKADGGWNSPKLQLSASLEAGYEISIKHGPGIAIGAYFDYGVVNVFKKGNYKSMIEISQIGLDPSDPVPTVKVAAITNSMNSIGSWEAGVKISINIK